MANTIENKVDGQRFGTGVEFKKDLLNRAREIQDRMLDNLPSNYTRDRNTNLAEFFRALAEEFARLEFSASDINNDKYHVSTRAEYLFLILGDLLFLGERSINDNLSDTEYRDFLIKVRNGYIGGSRPDNIESTVSDILGLPITLKQVYQSLRLDNTSYTIKDTHRMFFDILMDNANVSSDIGATLSDLKFFIDLIKPAHVIYDTRLIWSEGIDKRGDCTPAYDTTPMQEVVYYAQKMYVVTYAASSVYLSEVETGLEGWETGTVSSIDTTKKIIYLTNYRMLVYTLATGFFSRDLQGDDSTISVTSISSGDVIKYFAVKDSASTSELLEDDWSYSGVVSSINPTEEIITLIDNSKIVYNSDTLVYTRDGDGEYRVTLSAIVPTNELVFKGKLYTESFNFFNTPDQVLDNSYKQFDQAVIDKPSFQKNVRKILETKDGLPEGYHIIVEGGVAKVVEIDGRFYARAGAADFVERNIYRYSLYIDGEYQEGAQFSITEPQDPLSTSEAKQVFYSQFGYTQLDNPFTNYEIKISHTAKTFETEGSATIEAIGTSTQSCDRDAECSLAPFYEDTRKYWSWPEVSLTSGFIVFYQNWEVENDPGELNVPVYFAISDDPNEYVMPLLPVLDSNGDVASVSDLVVYVNGLKVEGAVSSLDPWTGIITLNFLPPFNSTVRVDYYYAARYPKPNSYIKEFRTKVQGYPGGGDLGAEYTILGSDSVINKLLWPFSVTDPVYSGDDLDYQVNKFPILTNKGKLATLSDVKVYTGTLAANGDLSVTVGSNVVSDPLADFSSVSEGDTIIIEAKNYLDGTLIYRVDTVVSQTSLILSSVFPNISGIQPLYPYRIIKFLEVEGAVTRVEPLLGHIRINFIPTSGSYLKFDYYHTHYNRKYVLSPDSLDGSIPDSVFNSYNNYTVIPDLGPGYDPLCPFTDDEVVLKIGYRYRVLNLANSAVLNSSDTLTLNSFSKKGSRASFKSDSGKLNSFNLMFSPEYLTDTDKGIILNDKYLEKNIPATTQLYKGTPPFVKSFSDDAHFVQLDTPVEINTYEGQTASHKDLQAGFSIINPDKSGDIDYNPVCQYTKKKSINIHSDLKMVSFPNEGGVDLPLSTITEGSKTLPISTTMIEQYYPNRELRVNDYLDFVNKVPDDIRTGSFKVLHGTKIVKSLTSDLRNLRRGDTLTVKDVAVIKWERPSGPTRVFYEDQKYVITDILDYQTAKLNRNFSGASNQYDYEVERDVVFNVDVALNQVQRKLILNGALGYSYSIPESILQHYPGYGDTGANFVLNFPDPDPDPYPRNPDNPSINGLPTGDPNTLFTNYTGQEAVVPLTSEIIYADGSTYLTGMSGLTGPSGAVDLGLTGPIGVPNPRIPSLDDDPLYNIPSGDSGTFLSYSESEYRVQWRNWDQDMIIVGLGETGAVSGQQGVLVEDPVNMLDDLGEGIKRTFWSVDKYILGETGLVDMFFFGSVIESSEFVEYSVPKLAYSDALIPLDSYQARVMSSVYRQGSYTGIQDYVAEFGLNEDTYDHKQLVIRELLHDNSFRVTEVRLFEPTS
jgi:hypothetical protein